MITALDLAEMDLADEVVDPVEVAESEWLDKRYGKITCSKFGTLIGSGKKKDEVFTKTGLNYLMLLAAERLGSWHHIDAKSMAWGRENESAAIAEYALLCRESVNAEPYQFFEFNPDVGGTPDATIGEQGCLEVKCPYDPARHVAVLLSREVPAEYKWQVNGHMLVTGRMWCDFVSFDPRIPTQKERLCVVRVPRNEIELEFLRNRLELAVAELKRMVMGATRVKENEVAQGRV